MHRENSLLSAIEEDAVVLFKYRLVIVHPQAIKLAECASTCASSRILQASRPAEAEAEDVEEPGSPSSVNSPASPKRTGRRGSTASRRAGPKPVDSCFFLAKVEPEASTFSCISSPGHNRTRVVQADMEAVTQFSENLPVMRTLEQARAIALVFVIVFDDPPTTRAGEEDSQSGCSLEPVFEHDSPSEQLRDIVARYHEYRATSKVQCPMALLCLNLDRRSQDEAMLKVREFVKSSGQQSPTCTKLFSARGCSAQHLYEAFQDITWYVETLAKSRAHVELLSTHAESEDSCDESDADADGQSRRCPCHARCCHWRWITWMRFRKKVDVPTVTVGWAA
mmetsp:Transcript_49136/g.114920  ORF Transcript_49136/g.114920 Transcript_49136/m.114920 type:complete len:337 (-) Transcript_49136:96-1106(-)